MEQNQSEQKATQHAEKYAELVNRNQMLFKAVSANFKEEMKYRNYAFYVDKCQSRRRWALKLAESPYAEDQLARSKSSQRSDRGSMTKSGISSPENSLMHSHTASAAKKRPESRSLSRSRSVYE